jgi:restriction endonuclease Mrr
MAGDAIEKAIAEVRAQTLGELRTMVRGASIPTLHKLAIDLVPPLFRNGYRGESGGEPGEHYADAIAHPRLEALPTFLVRLHSGAFSRTDAEHLRATMLRMHITQAALAIIGDRPLHPDARLLLQPAVPWLLDTDGLVNLMVNANVGVSTRVYDAKYVNEAYFRSQ